MFSVLLFVEEHYIIMLQVILHMNQSQRMFAVTTPAHSDGITYVGQEVLADNTNLSNKLTFSTYNYTDDDWWSLFTENIKKDNIQHLMENVSSN